MPDNPPDGAPPETFAVNIAVKPAARRLLMAGNIGNRRIEATARRRAFGPGTVTGLFDVQKIDLVMKTHPVVGSVDITGAVNTVPVAIEVKGDRSGHAHFHGTAGIDAIDLRITERGADPFDVTHAPGQPFVELSVDDRPGGRLHGRAERVVDALLVIAVYPYLRDMRVHGI